jgi:general secretion pathway protein D
MANRREMLLRGGLIAAVTASLGLFAAGGDRLEAPVAAQPVAAQSAPSAQRPVAKSERASILRRDAQARPKATPSPRTSWQPPPPPPPRPKLIAPEPGRGPAAPGARAPPLPSPSWRIEATGGKRVLYIVEGDKVHAVSEGETVNELHQVEPSADEMVFTYRRSPSRRSAWGTQNETPFTALLFLLAACATGQRLNHEGQELVDAGKFEDGIAKLDAAATLEPDNQRYRVDLLRARERSSDRILRAADQLRFAGKFDDARKLYERALVVNPNEPRARAGIAAMETEQRLGTIVAQAQAAFKSGDIDGAAERLRVVLMENPGQRDAQALQRQIEEQRVKAGFVGPVLRSRLTKPVSVQFREANLRQVFDGLSRSTGINFIFDREVRADLKTTIFARDVSVEDAVDLILLPNQLEKKVLSENTVLVYPNTPAKQREYQALVMKTFYLENADVKTTLNLVRTMLKTKDVFIDEKLNLLVMRDTPEVIRIAEKLIAAHDRAEPEVVLEIEVLEVARSRLTELGIKWPDQVSLGVIDTTGGVLTLEDLRRDLGRSSTTTFSPSPSVTLTARKTEGLTNLLSNPRVRVRNREKARVLVGDRLPVISAVITPSAVTPITTESVSYLDVGLKLEVEPLIYLDTARSGSASPSK